MSIIHYKFKASPSSSLSAGSSWHTVNFGSPALTCIDLKRVIVQQRRLAEQAEPFDLILTNATTGEEYRDENYAIHRGTSVLVKKVPGTREKCAKICRPPDCTDISMPATEEDHSIMAVLNASNRRAPQSLASFAQPQRFDPSSKPPPNYTCHRCGQKNHYIRFCPSNGDPEFEGKKHIAQSYKPLGSGMPGHFLAPVLDPKKISGGPDRPAQPQQQQQHAYPQTRDEPRGGATKLEFMCTVCSNFLHGALVVPCCYFSFCSSCLASRSSCPVCASALPPLPEIRPNQRLQRAVDDFRARVGGEAPYYNNP